MSSGLLAVVAVIYLGVAVGYWRQGRYGMAFAFVAYALANMGFVIDAGWPTWLTHAWGG